MKTKPRPKDDLRGLRYTEGTLIVDFVDVKTATSIWRGTAIGTLWIAQSNQQKIEKAIQKMAESIPSRG